MRVVIADDSALLREGLTRLLEEAGMTVCAKVAEPDALTTAVAEHRPDVALVDIRMPPTFTHEGAAAAVALKSEHPGLGVLLLSQAIETRFAAQLLEQHAERFGYLLKDRVLNVATLVGALETIVAGGTVVDPTVVQHLMRAHSRANPLLRLTEREHEVLALMAQGLSNSAIAGALVVTVKTVESHIANIFDKLGLHDEPTAHRRVLAVLAALSGADR